MKCKYYEKEIERYRNLFIKEFDENRNITLYHTECLFVLLEEMLHDLYWCEREEK